MIYYTIDSLMIVKRNENNLYLVDIKQSFIIKPLYWKFGEWFHNKILLVQLLTNTDNNSHISSSTKYLFK